ncbi:MAG: AbrB/MazE/SpoVT family DNA-binding domain-containing protein [Bosea sp. (in: a-proteobacteria)]
MATTRLSTKGQVILPKSLRDEKGLKAGVIFEVVSRPDGILLQPKIQHEKKYVLDDLIGILPYSGPPKTLAEMEQGIADAVKERWERKNR